MAESLSSSNDSLDSAVKRGDVEAVVSLLEQLRDLDAVDVRGWTALHNACWGGFLSIVKMLLDNGASLYSEVKSTGRTALHIAALRGYEDIVALLLRYGADVYAVDKRGYTTLLYGAQTLSENMLKQLLRYCDVSAVTLDGHTALSLACYKGRSRVSNFLIGWGADVHWVGTDPFSAGYTLVHYTAVNSMIETLQLLLDLKVNVNAIADDGMTALHMACEWPAPDSVECLLQNGAQVNYTCPNGFTALHLTALRSDHEARAFEIGQVAEILFKNGADVNAEDKDGRTPLDIALYKFCADMFKVFVKQLMNMKAQGLFVSENNLKTISENEEAKSFCVSCEEELERMRKSIIGNSSVNIYDIFTKGVNRLADFLSNENVERVLESENYKAEFPIYASAICEKFLHGRERRDLLRKSSDWLWAVICEFCELPYVCVQRINRYLMNTDLALQISHEPT